VIEEIGKLGKCHFLNMNNSEAAHKLPYAVRISLCEETERKIDNLLNLSKQMKIPINDP
jgi:hypothetical protein